MCIHALMICRRRACHWRFHACEKLCFAIDATTAERMLEPNKFILPEKNLITKPQRSSTHNQGVGTECTIMATSS
jgi:hypothetical protein